MKCLYVLFKRATIFSLLIVIAFNLYSQEKISLDFRNQKISDILLSLATVSEKTILPDETIEGSTTFSFNNENFEDAMDIFCKTYNLSYEVSDGIYYVSKIDIKYHNENSTLDVNAEDVKPSALVKIISRKSGITIMTDSFPNQTVTVRIKNSTVKNVLEIITNRYDGFELTEESGAFFIRDTGIRTQKKLDTRYSITEKGGLLSVNAQRVSFPTLIASLFKKGNKEYVNLSKNSSAMEDLYYSQKDFDTLLQIILSQALCDYTIKDNVYYIFDLQQKDSAGGIKETTAITLKYINAADALSLFPQNMNAQNFIKVDKTSNSLYLTGSQKEIQPLLNFIEKIDVPLENNSYCVHTLNNISVETGLKMIPKSLLINDPVIIPGTSSFISLSTPENEVLLDNFIKSIDVKDKTYAVALKYIKSSDLLKYIPPGTDKSHINETASTNTIFFTGTESQYQKFMEGLKVLDKPAEQIRYQMLVIQHQKSTGLNTGASFTISKTDDPAYSAITANLSNLVNINFDVVTQFGLQAAGSLNAEISENLAKVLADTTLNGISGEDITFENKNIYRYRDIITDTSSTATYSSVVKEISTGLSIKIKGWVSGDGMITVTVTADLSKQGTSNSSDSNSVPSTSEKNITTTVRTKSGVPIVISGLLQQEDDTNESGVPLLSKIPFLGFLFKTKSDSLSQTELQIYLVPFVEKSVIDLSEAENIRSLYEEFVKK
jgi:type II secretory pathway component GspD/PulD (secretin)